MPTSWIQRLTDKNMFEGYVKQIWRTGKYSGKLYPQYLLCVTLCCVRFISVGSGEVKTKLNVKEHGCRYIVDCLHESLHSVSDQDTWHFGVLFLFNLWWNYQMESLDCRRVDAIFKSIQLYRFIYLSIKNGVRMFNIRD